MAAPAGLRSCFSCVRITQTETQLSRFDNRTDLTELLSRKSETALVNSAALQGLRETEFCSPVWGHLLLGHRPLTTSPAQEIHLDLEEMFKSGLVLGKGES